MISFLDLEAQHASIRDELTAAMTAVLDSRQFVLGRYVEQFERSFAAYTGVQHAIAVNSGTSALHLALLAAGVEPGHEVITTPFTFVATVAAIRYCGATPVFVDIDPVTLNIRPELIAPVLTAKTKAILPVHLFGQPAEMDAINQIARRNRLAVIEDAAQAHGALYKGRRCGALGTLGCFSFYPTKNLGACGEGGMVTTDDIELAHRVRLLRDWGSEQKYLHLLPGFNYRMEGLQGAILNVKLRYLEQWSERRRSVAAQYCSLLTGTSLQLPSPPPHVRHVYHTYTVRTSLREQLRSRLSEAEIGTAIHYPRPVHLQPAYADVRFPEGSLPEAERAAREVLSLPMYPELTKSQIETVAHHVRQAVTLE